MERKRTRFHSLWRIDQDYAHRLSPKDRAWLAQFNDEYYRADLGEGALHPPGEVRREVYRAQNAAERDLVTATSDEVQAALTPCRQPSARGRYYTPDDYRMFGPPPVRFEEELAELLDQVALVATSDVLDVIRVLAGRAPRRPARRRRAG